jgi:hypothetical protein
VRRKRADLSARAVFVAYFATPVLLAGAIIRACAAATVFAGRVTNRFGAAASFPAFFTLANAVWEAIAALHAAVVADSYIAALSSPVLLANASF